MRALRNSPGALALTAAIAAACWAGGRRRRASRPSSRLMPGSGCERRWCQVVVRLTVGGRPLWALSEEDRCVQFDFVELLRRRVGDLLELADRYRTLVLSRVPPLGDGHCRVRAWWRAALARLPQPAMEHQRRSPRGLVS